MPTLNRAQGIDDPVSKLQVDTLDANCDKYGITEFRMNDLRQGIVHVIGPEQGATLPGMTVVCGDSHTSTHGALGALAFGIGTSEVEHVLATQTLLMKKAKSMLIKVEGELPFGCTAKDVVLHIIGIIGTAGGTGHAIIRRQRHPRAVRGRSHDRLQHGHRGRRPVGAGGGGRQDRRILPRPSLRAQWRAVGPGRQVLAHPAHRRGREVRHRGRG